MLGFEPRYAGIKTLCLTAWRHPNVISYDLSHNLYRCELVRILPRFIIFVNGHMKKNVNTIQHPIRHKF